MELIITHDCEVCEYEIQEKHLILPDEAGKHKIPLVFLGQQHFVCPICGTAHYTGDIEVFTDGDMEG